LRIALLEDGRRPVTLLDGNKLRTFLTSELSFSKEHRQINVERVSYVASLITKSGGAAIMALIAPYDETRKKARELIIPHGGFIEIYLSTPVEACEQNDKSGLYAKARQGEITQFTGIDAEYEVPKNPDIIINTAEVTVRQAIHEIILYLEQEGYLAN